MLNKSLIEIQPKFCKDHNIYLKNLFKFRIIEKIKHNYKYFQSLEIMTLLAEISLIFIQIEINKFWINYHNFGNNF